MRSEFLMSQLLRIMANLMRPDAAGPAEIGFRAMELISRLRSGGVSRRRILRRRPGPRLLRSLKRSRP